MFTLRYAFRLIWALFTRFKVLIFLSIGLGIIIFFALKFLIPILTSPDSQKIGIAGRYTPSTLPTEVLRKIGNGLTKLEPDGNAIPDLASFWETPDKGKTWIFTLKDEISWQDGKKITSQSINYQFSDVKVENPDPKTIIFKLQNPYSAFPSVVSKPTFKSGLLGTGEWEVKKIALAGTFVDKLTMQNKNGEKITYKFYPTEERSVLAFELGEINTLTNIINPSPLDTWEKTKLTRDINTGEFVAIFFNTEDKSLSDKSLRQALSYGINKKTLGDERAGVFTRAIGPISMNSWAYNSQIKPYNFDQEKARGMIDDFKKSAKISELTINLTSSPILLAQAEKISKDWEAIGVKVNLQVMASIPSDYQALLAIFDTPDDPDQYSIWHSTQTATNITRYNNPRIDKLLEDGRTQINSGERRKTYFDFQRFLVEDSPAAFLYYPTTYTIKR